jgi:bifunctional DNase/RNase
MNSRKVALRVKGVAMNPNDSMPIVILQDISTNRTFPVIVGPSEASAIIIELEGIVPPRPLTHDLLVSLFDRHGFCFDCVELYDIHDKSYLARMKYHKGLRKYGQEIRPSDAIALALRMKKPIYADETLLASGVSGELIMPEPAAKDAEIYYLSPDWEPRYLE